ncbi:MAG TPA: hypothetical protein VHH72_06680 [Solirubrobacterales bacterium]|jgi:hypothetical protein|nr:hypothetical protein [Solirubrobacterales bacterium]
MRRLLAVLALGTGLAAGCGGGDGEELVEEGPLRDCLTDKGLTIEPPDLSASAGLGSVSLDFRAATPDGTAVDFVVQGTAEKAERSAADIRAARAGFGGVGGEVIASRNAIAVFDAEPSDDARAAVEGCLGAQ